MGRDTILADAGEETPTPERFEAVLVIEGERTTDDREFVLNALTWRELPIPLTNAEEVGDDHVGIVIGRIEEITRVSLGNGKAEIRARGTFDLGSEAGREAARLVSMQIKRWVSIDPEPIDFDLLEEGDCDGEDGPFSPDCKMILHVRKARIAGAAIVAFPAFPAAVIVPEGTSIPAGDEDGRPATAAAFDGYLKVDLKQLFGGRGPLIAAGGPLLPPAEWFENPNLEGPTPLTITPEGRIFGHAATWGTCHIARNDVCLEPPRSAANYAYYRTGATQVACDCGDETHDLIPTGVITLGTGHASLDADPRAAAAHYDNTGTAVADVAAGEDDYGPWVAGAVRPGITDEQLRVLRASSISGDWRRIGGNLEMVATLAVNVPGFPIPRAVAASAMPRLQARVAQGEVLALVASGTVRQPAADYASDMRALRSRVERLEKMLKPLEPAVVAALVERVG